MAGPVPFDQLVTRLEARVGELAVRASGGAEDAKALVDEMLGELSVSLEELEVASEELRFQNESLEAAAERLAEERERYESLFSLSPDACMVTDDSGLISDLNEAAQAMLGVSSAEGLLRRPLAGFVTGADQRAYYRFLGMVSDRDGIVEFECDLQPFRSPALRVWVRACRRPGAAGEPPDVLWVIRDITERVRAQAAVEQANRFREALILSVAHDLRSPVALIGRFLNVLEGRGTAFSPSTVSDMMHEIGPAIRGVKSVIDNLLDVDRAGRGAVEAVRVPTALPGLVARAVGQVGLQGRTDLDVQVGRADVDPVLTERTLTNLLVNAARYGPTDAQIGVRVLGSEGGIEVRVDDTGPGVPDALKESVFDLYQQVARTGPGAGIGLFLVRRFAELQGGRAWLVDRPGGGTSARVFLACEHS